MEHAVISIKKKNTHTHTHTHAHGAFGFLEHMYRDK
jgi:hypothetical protein